MTPAMKLASSIPQQLRWAELNEYWSYFEKLLDVVKEMGGRVMRVADERFQHRFDYLIEFRQDNALPGTLK